MQGLFDVNTHSSAQSFLALEKMQQRQLGLQLQLHPWSPRNCNPSHIKTFLLGLKVVAPQISREKTEAQTTASIFMQLNKQNTTDIYKIVIWKFLWNNLSWSSANLPESAAEDTKRMALTVINKNWYSKSLIFLNPHSMYI